MYPERNQMDPDNPICSEESAYPAAPDSEYGWKSCSVNDCNLAFARNYGMEVRVARLHNIFGELGTWAGGREKVPAAMCRKIAEAEEGSAIEMWGDGEQTRSFLHVSECIEGILRLMRSDWEGPVNIGSEEWYPSTSSRRQLWILPGNSLRLNRLTAPYVSGGEIPITG